MGGPEQCPDLRPEEIPFLKTESDRAETEVQVPDGQTTVISGILQTTEETTNQRTPGISKVPLLGWLFKSNSNTTRNQEYGVINYRTREGAVRSAITYCRRRANHPGNCHHTTSARNTCLAVARAYVRKKGVVRMRWCLRNVASWFGCSRR